jgi:hypothetical protein
MFTIPVNLVVGPDKIKRIKKRLANGDNYSIERNSEEMFFHFMTG